jgi:hypothetical protein
VSSGQPVFLELLLAGLLVLGGVAVLLIRRCWRSTLISVLIAVGSVAAVIETGPTRRSAAGENIDDL